MFALLIISTSPPSPSSASEGDGEDEERMETMLFVPSVDCEAAEIVNNWTSANRVTKGLVHQRAFEAQEGVKRVRDVPTPVLANARLVRRYASHVRSFAR